MSKGRLFIWDFPVPEPLLGTGFVLPGCLMFIKSLARQNIGIPAIVLNFCDAKN